MMAIADVLTDPSLAFVVAGLVAALVSDWQLAAEMNGIAILFLIAEIICLHVAGL
jgi:hypothetical protein